MSAANSTPNSIDTTPDSLPASAPAPEAIADPAPAPLLPQPPAPAPAVLAETAPAPPPPPAAAVEMVEKQVYNPETDRWEKKQVPVTSLTEASVSEVWDRYESPMDLGPEWDRGPGQEFHAFWAHIDPRHHQAQRRQGYAPLRPDQWRDPRFQVGTIPGVNGPVIQQGDVFLMVVPKADYEARKKRDLDRLEREQAERLGGMYAELSEVAARAGYDNGGTPAEIRRLQHEGSQHGARGYETIDPLTGERYTQSRAEIAAEAEAAQMAEARLAAERELAQNAAQLADAMDVRPSRSVFGGFQGSPEYNRWQPSGPKPNWGYSPAPNSGF